MSNMGWSDRSSQAANPIRASTPTTNEVSTRVLVQPWLLPSTRPRTTPSKPVLTTATPTRSRRARAPRDSDNFRQANGTNTTPIGTFSQKMYCHDHPLVIAPPTRGPIATAAPPMAPQIPRATLRRSGGTAALNRVSDKGMIMAPPAP